MTGFEESKRRISKELDKGMVDSRMLKGNFADIFFNVAEERTDIDGVLVEHAGKIAAEIKFFNKETIFVEDLDDPEIRKRYGIDDFHNPNPDVTIETEGVIGHDEPTTTG